MKLHFTLILRHCLQTVPANVSTSHAAPIFLHPSQPCPDGCLTLSKEHDPEHWSALTNDNVSGTDSASWCSDVVSGPDVPERWMLSSCGGDWDALRLPLRCG